MIPQINLFWIKKNKYQIIIILLLFIVLFQCQNHNENNKLNTHKFNADKSHQKAQDVVIKSNDIIINYKDIIKNKDIEILKLKNDSIKNSRLVIYKLNELKTYNSSDIAKYYIDRYNKPNAIKSVSMDEVTIKDTLSRFIISDLIKYDGIKYDYTILTNMYNLQNSKFQSANTTIDTLKISINNISNAYENTIDENKLAIKEIEKQLRKEKRNKTLYKIATVAAIVGGGYLLVK